MSGQTIILCGAEQRNFACKMIMRAPINAVCNIREATRSSDQNAKLWAMLSDISRAKPDNRMHTPEVWKALMMKACGHAIQFVLGIDGEPFPVGFRSSRLSKSQMNDLIAFTQEYGDRKNVQWSWHDDFYLDGPQ